MVTQNGWTGLEFRDKTMADKYMYIPNYNTSNYPFCRSPLVAEMFGHPF